VGLEALASQEAGAGRRRADVEDHLVQAARRRVERTEARVVLATGVPAQAGTGARSRERRGWRA